MMSDPKKVIVVGGGIAGIVSAMLWAKRGAAVTLIEASDQIGGLLCSYTNRAGAVFDHGTHILKRTGIEGLDDLLYSQISEDRWNILDRLKAGGFFHGELCSTSQFVDLRALPGPVRNAAVYELLNSEPVENIEYLNASEYAKATYGPTLTNDVIAPVTAKLFGKPLEEMQSSALGLVGLTRFIGFDRFASQQIKKSDFFDVKFGYSTWDDGISDLENYYPKFGGIQTWIDELVVKLISLDVKIETDCRLTNIHLSDQRIVSIETNRFLSEVDEVCWTVSPGILLNALQASFPGGMKPPQFRSSALIHGVVDRDFDSDLYFLFCHDPELVSYRITLYSNLRGGSANGDGVPFNFTVEVMADDVTVNDPALGERVISEMRRIGVIGASHQVTFCEVVTSEKGFPLPTSDFVENSLRLAEHCEQLAVNLTLFGRATGRVHFMHDVLTEIWRNLAVDKNP